MILRCQPGYELFLEKEIRPLGYLMSDSGGGWLAARTQTADASGKQEPADGMTDLCFAHWALIDPVEVSADSVNGLAGKIVDYFFESIRTERFEGEWPLVFECASGLDGLGRRADGVEKAFGEILKKRMSRVAKLAVPGWSRAHATPNETTGSATIRGLFVLFTDFKQAYVSRTCVRGGQRRMADDPLAPSRSYLKVEEAYGVLGLEPASGETVVDLGAAPGGWSYSAAKRGARVIAVDNGPLKAGALDNPLIEHRREDAFRFEPSAEIESGRADWLFCDLVEEPHHVLSDLIEPWIEKGWCRKFVVNLKFGRVDPLALLREVRAPGGVLASNTRQLHIRHLYHDREEFTLVGIVKD